MGENKHESFKHNLNYQNWPVFGRDQGVDEYDVKSFKSLIKIKLIKT